MPAKTVGIAAAGTIRIKVLDGAGWPTDLSMTTSRVFVVSGRGLDGTPISWLWVPNVGLDTVALPDGRVVRPWLEYAIQPGDTDVPGRYEVLVEYYVASDPLPFRAVHPFVFSVA